MGAQQSQTSVEASSGNDAQVFVSSSLFTLLNDDVVVEILSYIVGQVSCVQVIPSVCKQFRDICNFSEVLWMTSLEHLFIQDPTYENAVKSLVDYASSLQTFGNIKYSPPWALEGKDTPLWKFKTIFRERKLSDMSIEEIRIYVRLVCDIVDHSSDYDTQFQRSDMRMNYYESAANSQRVITTDRSPMKIVLAKQTYLKLIHLHMISSLPVLHYPIRNKVKIGHTIRLDLSAAHYNLIEEVLKSQSEFKKKRGTQILSKPRPEFIFAYREHLYAGMKAFIVELCQYSFQTRRAEIYFTPFQRIKLIQMEEREGNDGLFNATFRRSQSIR